MRIYGLTGGTGSGKSEVARRFMELGIPVIDADKVGHQILEPGGIAVEAVVQAFGEKVLTNARIDREKLGALIFSDEIARRTLNAIVHPLIKRGIAERCVERAQQGHPAVLVDAALLAESGRREEWLDGLIVVTCRDDLRLKRLVESRGINAAMARLRMAAQTPPELKIPLADWVIENEGTIEQLRERVDEIASAIRNHPG
jgi:dephospho-CoA kinase